MTLRPSTMTATPQSPPSSKFSDASLDPIVCHCHNVRESQIRDAVAREGAETVAEVSSKTCAGGSCQACHCKIKRVLKGEPAICASPFSFCSVCNTIGTLCICKAA